MTIRVLIVDDIAETREHLTRLLGSESDIEVIAVATGGLEAIEMSERLQPDVVLMDVNMRDMDGITATERLVTRVPRAGVVMMSVQGEADYLRRAMLAGARGFLVKPFSLGELAESIRQVHRREMELLETVKARLPSGNGHGPEAPGEVKPGRIVALFAPKGGVGRTTLAVNLAAAAADSGRRVCLVDASFQFGDVGIMLNLNPKSNSIGDLVAEMSTATPESVADVLVSHSSGMKVLLAPPSPEVAELIQPQFVRRMLEALRAGHELVVVDTTPSLHDATLGILDVADVILGVLTLEITNIKSMRLFLQLADSLEYLRKLEVVLNRSDAALGIEVSAAEQSLGRKIDHTVVSDGRTVVYALNRGVPFTLSSPDTQVSRDVKRLAEHLLLGAEVPASTPTDSSTRKSRRKSLLAWR